ncbi:MAG: large conductance mechanosensitive channel protein MscL [Chloroflexota bacterium]|nr:MAG: large conductance mechanosensitive channel protein MscL [Chloroflexota bacterium]
MLKEFREFALKGNVLDLAIGVIIGAAFGRIITSLVEDIIMPPLGLLLGQINYADYFIALDGNSYPSLEVAQTAAAPTLNYGLFINNIVNFLLVAFALFLIIRGINRMRRKAPPPETNTKECPFCASAISIKARRCPECTSELPVTASAAD